MFTGIVQIQGKVFRTAPIKEGLKVEIVVPESLNFPSGLKKAENRTYLDPEIHYLKLKVHWFLSNPF